MQNIPKLLPDFSDHFPESPSNISHLARRCFVGNLYKQVKDPNLVGALSGHKRGNRAFARYRVTDEVAKANAKEIDEDMKRDLVSMLE